MSGSARPYGGGLETRVTELERKQKASAVKEWVSVLDHIPQSLHTAIIRRTITEDLTPYLTMAADTVSDAGGGVLWVPPGLYPTTGWTLGDGSISGQSTKHHKIHIIGAGRGAAPSLSNAQPNAVTCFKYIGATDANKPVIELAGPLHNIQLENFQIDCDGKAGIGLLANNITDFQFNRVQVLKFTATAYKFTTVGVVVSGAPYGCGNGVVLDCYSYDPANNTATAIEMTSGGAGSLIGSTDTANVDVIGGVYFYGGSTGSRGLHLHGADNNTFYGCQFIPSGGHDGGGNSVYFTQWAASPVFPLENAFYNLGISQNVGGNSGTGGNTFVIFPSSDGAAIPTLDYVATRTQDGKEYVNGARVYRSRTTTMATLNGSVQSNPTTTWADIPGLSVTLTTKADTKLRVSFHGRAAKSVAGEANFILALNGARYGATFHSVYATGYYAPVGASYIFDVGAGSQTVSAQFASNDTNAAQISHGALVVEELV